MKPAQDRDLYSPKVVSTLFDEMSKTYGFVNMVASLGFTMIWRRVVVTKLKLSGSGLVVVDLMTGMGELFRDLRAHAGRIRKLAAIDFSAKMCERAREHARKNPFATEVIEADVFDGKIASESVDVVVSSFGLKTFSLEQQKRLAEEVDRILKPGGQFSFIEISMPSGLPLRLIYSVYLGLIIPVIGKLCLGNPDNYRYLGIYTKNFGNSRKFHSYLVDRGLKADYFEHFFGCASGVTGTKRA